MKMKKLLTTIIAVTLILTIFASSSPALANNAKASTTPTLPIGDLALNPTDEAITFTTKMINSGLVNEFDFDKNENLILKDSYANLQLKYNLDDAYIKQLKLVLANGQKKSTTAILKEFTKGTLQGSIGGGTVQGASSGDVVLPQIFVSDWKVYFTYDEMMALVFTAAMIGPAALAGTITAIGTMIGGPVGTVLALLISVAGLPTLGYMCYVIVQSASYNRGFYAGISWNGVYPNPAIGTWW